LPPGGFKLNVLRIGLAISVGAAFVLLAAVVAANQQLACTNSTLVLAPCWVALERAIEVGAVAIVCEIAGMIAVFIAWFARRRQRTS
jgi:hypothetical protein